MRQSGEVVAGFRVERLIGSGGMGEVYLVQHPRLPRLDALKLLPIAASSDPSYRERFQREADLAASLDHDNVVPVYDRGETGGQLWIHMKYVAGQDAAAALASSGPFGVQRALHVITRVAAALDDAHRHGLLHRDVKPANILLGTAAEPGGPDRVYLTDFGIAKGAGDAAGLTPSGHFAASLDYAAPEQIQMRPLSGKADQYALGCVLFQLLTGSIPFPGDGAWARMNAHLSAPVPAVGQLRPGLPLGVQAVLDRAMAKDPDDRFDSCGAMAAAFAEALRGPVAPGEPETQAGPGSGTPRWAADTSATGCRAAARDPTARLRGAVPAEGPAADGSRAGPAAIRTGPFAAMVAADRSRGGGLRSRRGRARTAFALPSDQPAGRYPISCRGRDGTVRRWAAAHPAAAGRRHRPAPHA